MKFLHTMIRVGDLEKSIRFYSDHLGMQLLRKKDYPGGKFTLAFVGYGHEKDNTVLELTDDTDEGKLLGITVDLLYDSPKNRE